MTTIESIRKKRYAEAQVTRSDDWYERQNRRGYRRHRDIDWGLVAFISFFVLFFGGLATAVSLAVHSDNVYNHNFKVRCEQRGGYTIIGDKDICLTSKNVILEREH